jgi:endoglucanase
MKESGVAKALAVGVFFVCSSASLVADVYTVDDGQIRHNGNRINLYGVNWFGFETPDHVVHGLWAREYKDMIAQMQSLGFNAVRLPFCPETLRNTSIPADMINESLNQDLVGLSSLAVLDHVVSELNARGMYIVIDHHRPDCEEISELWYTPIYSEADWISDLRFVATRYADLSHLLGVDLKNEPHGAATWGLGNAATDWNLAAERAGAAVLAANPDILIFVQGIQENPVCSSSTNHWWGGNLEPQQCFPLSLPPEKLVLSPHVYGPDVYLQPYFEEADFPSNMPSIWDTQFGNLTDQGQSVVLGEFGGKYGHGGDPRGVVWQNALVDYLVSQEMGDFFYWSWNANSGDTGGILKNDWVSVWEDKYLNLRRLMDAHGGPYCDVRVNDADGPVVVTAGERVSVTVRLDTGAHGPRYQADWWMLAQTSFPPPHDWYHFNLVQGWIPGFAVTHQGPIYPLIPAFETLDTSTLPSGSYTFYFGVDLTKNGTLDPTELHYDQVKLIVQ